MSEVSRNNKIMQTYKMNQEHIDIICKEWPRFEVVECLGEGGFGTVYKVRKHTANSDIVQTLAVKIVSLPKDMSDLNTYFWDMQSDAEEREKVIQELVNKAKKEVQLEMELKDPHIITIHDHAIIKKENGLGYYVLIAMDLLESFEPYMKRAITGSKEEVEAVARKVGSDICDALIACEKKNIVHRDIKPNNILVNENGDFVLTDFGLAKEIDMMASRSNTGTPAYRAPEVESGKYGEDAKKIDIYSLGIVLYQICNFGRFPFLPPYPEKIGLAAQAEAYQKKMQGDTMSLPKNCSEEFGKIILKACEFVPQKRYMDAESFKKAIMNPSAQLSESHDRVIEEKQQVFEDDKDCKLNETISQVNEKKWQEQVSVNVENYNSNETTYENIKEKKKKKSKVMFVIIAEIMLIALIGAGIVCFHFGKNNSSTNTTNRTMEKAGAESVDKALLQNDEKTEDTKAENIVVEEDAEYTDIYKMFSYNEMTYEEALTELEKTNLNSSEKQDWKTKLSNMENSHSAYEKGKSYYDNGFYEEAKEQLVFVKEEDGNYDDAEYMLNTCNSKLEKTILASAEEYANAGNYEEAIKCLTEYVGESDNSVQAEVALTKYQSTYADSVIQQANELLAQEAYDEANSVMETALELLPENQVINAKYEECLQYKPADLSVLPVPELTEACYVSSDEKEAKDTLGNVYDSKNKAIVVANYSLNEGRSSIYLGKKYDFFSMTLSCGDGTASSFQMKYNKTVSIYFDDVLVDTYIVSRSFSPVELKYETKDVDMISVTVEENNLNKLEVILSDVKAWNE